MAPFNTLSPLPQVRVYHEKDLVEGCPFSVRAVPLISLEPRPSGIDPCALGSTVEVLVSQHTTLSGVLQCLSFTMEINVSILTKHYVTMVQISIKRCESMRNYIYVIN